MATRNFILALIFIINTSVCSQSVDELYREAQSLFLQIERPDISVHGSTTAHDNTIAKFNQILEIDNSHVRSLLYRGIAYTLMIPGSSDGIAEYARSKAKQDFNRVSEIAPGSAEGYLAKSFYHVVNRDFASETDRNARKGIELQSENPWFYYLKFLSGQYNERQKIRDLTTAYNLFNEGGNLAKTIGLCMPINYADFMMLQRAIVKKELGDLSGCCEDLRSCLMLPDQVMYKYYKAWCD